MKVVIGVMGIDGKQEPGSVQANFREAQIAVAKNPEFKGTVAALETAKFWDYQLAELSNRARALKKAKKTDPPNLKPLTPEEEQILKVGVSDADFHYLGSGKIMAGIGKGFAEEMIQLEEKESKK